MLPQVLPSTSIDSPALPDPPNSLPLYKNLLLEWSCAIAASFTVAPVVSIVDRSIIENASGKTRLLQGIQNGVMQLLNTPSTFLRQPAFLLIWGVYAGTYMVGNTIEMACTRTEQPVFLPKFVGSSIANVTLSVGKDQIFTRMFGSGVPTQLFPQASYALFATRDSLTILSGFSLPPTISRKLQNEYGWSTQKADIVSQLTAPCAMQFLSCPLHLTGIDIYNRPKASAIERIALIRKEYWPTVAGRIGRIFPAFGLGGVLNKHLRSKIY